MTVVLVILTIVVFIAVEAVRLRLAKRSAPALQPQVSHPFADVHFPCGLFVGEGHSWARLTESGELKLGADELIAQAIGGADRIELPEIGTEVQRGQPLATIWRLGRKLEVTSPVDGTVVAANDTVKKTPGAFGADPYGIGWLAMVWPVEHTEALKQLRVGEKASKWLQHEIQRFTEFLARRTSPNMIGAVLPDGSHPLIGSALALNESAWQEFRGSSHRPSPILGRPHGPEFSEPRGRDQARPVTGPCPDLF